jgi:SAM-dependent methyltransferase
MTRVAASTRHRYIAPKDTAAEPVCLLNDDMLAQRSERPDALLGGARVHETFEGGALFRFEAAPGIWERVSTFIDEERDCCPFFAFEQWEEAGDVVLRITRPGADSMTRQKENSVMAEPTAEQIKSAVVERYGSRARTQLAKEETIPVASQGDSCCGSEAAPVEETSNWAEKLYAADELGTLPKEVSELSLGCGNPAAIAALRPGEAVLDLGSGSGLDCFLSAQAVGPGGRVVGLDMTDDMLALAQRNLAKIGATNVEFHKGEMESMPLPDVTFDVIISNCVINLSPDKDAVFRESLRVLKPGGRLSVSDIVWAREPTEAERTDLASWAGCVAGALKIEDYTAKLRNAGFSDVTVELAGKPDERGWASAYITAHKPAAGCC